MRKRIIAVVLLFLLIAVPVSALSPTFVIDGMPYYEESILKDGKLYVPLRVVTDRLGLELTWNGAMATVETKVNRPQIPGDEQFKAKVTEALDLLEAKDVPHYVMLCQNVRSIWQGTESDDATTEKLIVFARCKGGVIVICPAYYNNKTKFIPEYLAGILVHEACHSAWYENYKKNDEKLLDTNANETMAYVNELTALILLDAPEWVKIEVSDAFATIN